MKMKIWLDLRFIKDNLYSTFVIELVQTLIKQSSVSEFKDNSFVIYTNQTLDLFDSPNTTIKKIWIKNFSIKEQINFFKILKKDSNNLVIFFNIYKPIFYVWTYFTIIPSLKEVYYSNFPNIFNKYTYLYLLEKNLKRSNKIICFDQNTNNELVEKFNIHENKIYFLKWFFPNSEKLNNLEDLKVNIKTKYNIKNDFFIYSGWEWVEKNYDKLIYLIDKLNKNWYNLDLVFLWDTIAKNITLRNLILKLEIHTKIHFIWVIKPNEKILFYKNSKWVIFPSFYEPFPFRLTEPLYFNTQIISSNLDNIKNIFWESINYFSPLSINSMYEETIKYLNEEKIINYNDIKSNYTKENTVNELLEIIK